MVDGKINGIGKRSNKKDNRGVCNETYLGEWKAGVLNGFGKYVDKINNIIYVGEFKQDQYHGHGIVEQRDVYRYEGDFLFGQPHGKGKLVNQKETCEG